MQIAKVIFFIILTISSSYAAGESYMKEEYNFMGAYISIAIMGFIVFLSNYFGIT